MSRLNLYFRGLALILLVLSAPLHAQKRMSLIQNIINQVNIDSLVFFVKELSGNVPTTIGGTPYTIVSRHKNNSANDKAGEYIKQKLESYGIPTSIIAWSSTGKNVIGIKQGTRYPNQKFMICAHFDDMPSGSLAPGADDNASGTAAVIEAARVLSQYTFPYTIIFALWDEEEQGLVGSANYANQLTANDSLLGVINLDMIAWDSNNDNKMNIHVRNIANSPALSSKMLEVNSMYGIGIVPVIKTPGITASDHASFWNKNISAVLLIEDDDNDFNAYYHTTNDIVSRFNNTIYHKAAKISIATLATYALDLNMRIQHTPMASTVNGGNITLNATVQTGLGIGTGSGAPRLWYRVNTGSGFSSFTDVVGQPTGTPGLYNFTIQNISLGSAVQYYIAAQDSAASIVATSPEGGSGFNPPGHTPPVSLHQFYVAPTVTLMSDTANVITDWSKTANWNVTTGKYVSAPYSFTESPAGNYLANENCYLMYNQSIDLTTVLGAELEFDAQWNIENNYDYGMFQVSTDNGATWIALAGQYTNPGTGSFQPNGQPLYDAVQSSWVRERIDLSAYTGKVIKIRFYFRSDASLQYDGWYIDNIMLKSYTIVPVELVSFTAIVTPDNSVLVEWSTASEINNKGFEVEKSLDGNHWITIAFIAGHGTTSSSHNYSYTEKNPATGLNHYRLKQIDYDGSMKIYDAIVVNVKPAFSFELSQNYPNPFNPVTKINYTLPQSGYVKLAVYNMLGERVSVLENSYREAGNHTVEFQAYTLPGGMYIYVLETGEYKAIKKLVLLK